MFGIGWKRDREREIKRWRERERKRERESKKGRTERRIFKYLKSTSGKVIRVGEW